MDHKIVYQNIINKAISLNRKKTKNVYLENHHITPKCLGGTDNADNLVLLTPREHYICHKLLTYMFPGNVKLIFALLMMTHDKQERKISSRDYAHAKELQKFRIGPKTLETKLKMSKARKGRSYEDLYGSNSELMRNKRRAQTTNKGNPNAKKYLIHNINTNKTWYCTGNFDKFCIEQHVAPLTLRKSRKRNDYVNGWKCEYVNEIPTGAKIFGS